MNLNKEDLKAINQSISKQVKKAVEAILEAGKKVEAGQRNYYRETEKLLYSYPALKLKIAQDEEDLQNGIIGGGGRRSTDVIYFSPGRSRQPEEQVQEELERSRRASMERTRIEVTRIDRALETIQDDQYYNIIPMRYFDCLKPEEIADAMACDERTYRRNKSRLVNKLKIVLFGADAL